MCRTNYLRAFHNHLNEMRKQSEEEIIKNPFDIVQLTLQLFAPLTELMELRRNSPCAEKKK